jgi:hypothetical protein
VEAVNWDAVVGVTAIVAVVISLVSLIISMKSGRAARRTREGMVHVQQQMADALGRVAEAQEAQGRRDEVGASQKQLQSTEAGGTPSVRLIRTGSRSHQLQIENMGPGRIEIVDLQVLGQPEIVVRGGGDPRGVELHAGEEFNVIVAITLGTHLPLEVLTKWRDATGIHDRVQRVSLA